MDIGSKGTYPASDLSNFAPHAFLFDGVECFSMEGLLQSFKFRDHDEQKEVCKLIGISAKRRGQVQNTSWKREQVLWWKGQPYDRHGVSYQELLDRAFDALSENSSFCDALRASGAENLTHSIGTTDPRDTVLSEVEFCSRLMRIRARLTSTTQ